MNMDRTTNASEPEIREPVEEPSMFGFMLELLRIRGWIIWHFLVVLIASAVIAFLIPKSYTSSLTFLPPDGGGGGGLSNLLNGFDGLSLKANSAVSANQVRSIFESEQLRRILIDNLRLDVHFDVDPKKAGRYFKTDKLLSEQLDLISDEQLGVGLTNIASFTIIFEDESPDTAVLVVKEVFRLVDSTIRATNVEQARRNRQFIESQLAQRLDLLRKQEKNLVAFQKKTKIFNAPYQVEASLRAASELKAKLIEQQTIANMLKISEGSSSSRSREVSAMIATLKGQIATMESRNDADILPGLNRAADLGSDYLELYREVEISTKVVLLLSQQLEMFRLDEARIYSSLAIVSDAQLPDYKSAPKRVLLIGLMLVGEHLFMLMLLGFLHVHRTKVRNSNSWQSVLSAWRGKA